MAATARDGAPDYTNLRLILGVAAAVLLFALWILFYAPLGPLYSVAIDSVSGLDVSAPDRPLNPQFNLTLRVASQSLGRSGCMEAGAYLEVSYRCVMLAASGAAPERICAGPSNPRDVSVVARGAGVRLPGHMMDGLVADLRNGAHDFEITVRLSNDDFSNAILASCGGRQVGGDTAAALETACHWSYLCPDHDQDRRRNFVTTSTEHISSSLYKVM